MEGVLRQPVDQGAAEHVPIIVPEVQDLIPEGGGLRHVKRSLGTDEVQISKCVCGQIAWTDFDKREHK